MMMIFRMLTLVRMRFCACVKKDMEYVKMRSGYDFCCWIFLQDFSHVPTVGSLRFEFRNSHATTMWSLRFVCMIFRTSRQWDRCDLSFEIRTPRRCDRCDTLWKFARHDSVVAEISLFLQDFSHVPTVGSLRFEFWNSHATTMWSLRYIMEIRTPRRCGRCDFSFFAWFFARPDSGIAAIWVLKFARHDSVIAAIQFCLIFRTSRQWDRCDLSFEIRTPRQCDRCDSILLDFSHVPTMGSLRFDFWMDLCRIINLPCKTTPICSRGFYYY